MALRETIFHRLLRQPYVLHAGSDDGPATTPAVTVVFLHGIGRTSRMWSRIASRLTDRNPDMRVIAIDLLGFGGSARPDWQAYNAAMQARSLRQTLRTLHVRGPVIMVGHSLGALVAAEYARSYPHAVAQLLLASAPIYRKEPEYILRKFPKRIIGESFYKGVLRNLRSKQELTKKLNLYGRKVRIFAEDFVVDDSNVAAVARSIELAIENQSTYDHIVELTVPTLLLYGRLDPFLIRKYYRYLSRANRYVSVASVVAGHEVSSNRRFSAAIVRHVERMAAEIQKSPR